MNTENFPILDRIVVLSPRPAGFKAGMATPVAACTPSEDFNDDGVFVRLESNMPSSVVDLYYGQSPSGRTHASITRNVSDAALIKFADRHGLALDALQAFRDEAEVGATMLVERADALAA